MSQPYADIGALRPDDRSRFANAWPRYVNLLLGVWLFVSAFAWPHSRDACGAAWISGAMISINAFGAIWASPARLFNVLLGGMALLWQNAAAHDEPVARVNGIVVSALIVLISLIPARSAAES